MASPHSELARLSRDWTKLGLDDPLWAVCVDPDRRGGRWDVGEFMASGRAEIAAALDRLDQLGICQARSAALDFGCGVGRLTAALNDYFDSVTGVDISSSMLDRARGMLSGRPGCRVVHNASPDLKIFPDASFDLVYSSLVLQHMPRALACAYLTEFVRVTRPGGAVVILVPERHRPTPRGAVYALTPRGFTGLVQRTIFRYPAPMQMTTLPARRVRREVERCGARLVASDPRSGVGQHWRMSCHFIARDAPSADSGLVAPR
ncbi:MAG TPA: class I SAM-dependent methyltransferase [Streptosporangiaceae bacterium]|nr:class I SAM-dependent methyltransferase [Streptosporangiaceae bacterium]